MKLYSKNIVVNKSLDEIQQIIRGAAHKFSRPCVDENAFSIRVMRGSHSGKGVCIFPIKGAIIPAEEGYNVMLELHVGLLDVINGTLLTMGVVGLLACGLGLLNRWYCFVGMIIIVAWNTVVTHSQGRDALAQLERKLQG